MKTSEKLEILDGLEDHLFRSIQQDTLAGDTIRAASHIQAVQDSRYLRAEILADSLTPRPEDGLADETTSEGGATPAAEPDAPEPEPVHTAEPEPAEEASYPDKKEVRMRLAKISRDKGVDIAPLMAKMGYSKFGDIPASRYEELLALAQSAGAEES